VVNQITPRTACRYLRDITDGPSQFHTCDGITLRNLIDLSCYLKSCGNEAFKYHVSPNHNHFSNWVENSILDKHLATQLSFVLDKNPMRLMTTKRVNELVHHATRKPTPREKAAMILEDVILPEEQFVTNDGRVIRNLWELKEFVNSAKENVISYHLSPAKNDFYDWIGGVLMDAELAEKVVKANDKKDLSKYIEDRLSHLEAFRAHKPRFPSLPEHVDQIKKRSGFF